MKYTIYKIEYKNLVYYGCTNNFSKRKLEHVKQIFDLIFCIRRNDFSTIKSKTLFEIAKKINSDYKFGRLLFRHEIQRIISIDPVAKVQSKLNASKIENTLITLTDNINKSKTLYV